MRPIPSLLAAALLVALVPTAHAQRASLADRVAILEQRSLNAQGNTDLLNQLAQLRSEVQALRAQVEELQQANEQLRSTQRAMDLDTDSRLQRLEGGAPRAAAPGASGAAASTAAPAPVTAAPRRPAPASSAAAPRATTARGGASVAIPTGAELDAYNVAFDALKAGRYADASRLFADFLDRYPGGVYAPNGLYWLGESYYATRNYALALEQFEQLLDRFPTHDKAPGALLKVGLTRLSLRQDDAARAAFAEVVERYPDTDAARSAAERLQALAGR